MPAQSMYRAPVSLSCSRNLAQFESYLTIRQINVYKIGKLSWESLIQVYWIVDVSRFTNVIMHGWQRFGWQNIRLHLKLHFVMENLYINLAYKFILLSIIQAFLNCALLNYVEKIKFITREKKSLKHFTNQHQHILSVKVFKFKMLTLNFSQAVKQF